MRREQLIIVALLAVLVTIFGFESYLIWYGDEYHRTMARAHVAMAPGLFGVGWSLLLFILVATALLYYISRINLRDDALSILKTRYAKGEITKEEYLQKLKDLMHEAEPKSISK